MHVVTRSLFGVEYAKRNSIPVTLCEFPMTRHNRGSRSPPSPPSSPVIARHRRRDRVYCHAYLCRRRVVRPSLNVIILFHIDKCDARASAVDYNAATGRKLHFKRFAKRLQCRAVHRSARRISFEYF